MPSLGLETEIVDRAVYENTVRRFREAGVRLPTFAQLAEPARIPDKVRAELGSVDPDAPDPRNLFRVHWHNSADRREVIEIPGHVVLDKSLTGVEAPIIVAVGNRFPMIESHKVLAAYGCLAPRVVTGQYDPTAHRAVWPSTGNYCRGGAAISRILGCRAVAVLPEGMSAERFEWLARWIGVDEDIIRTPGSESNVKEIYDACNELDKDPKNIIFNQFCEFGNHLIHYAATGSALSRVFETFADTRKDARLFAFISASGSAGTLGAGDWLKEHHGSKTVAVEALECPTLLYNGYGAHNIQGIGDKHVPYIHNVMNTDVLVGISDRATDELHLLFQSPEGRRYLHDRRGLTDALIQMLPVFGLSSICNVLACIKVARAFDLGPDDVLATVATDGAAMYDSETERLMRRDHPEGFDMVAAAEAYGEHLLGAGTDHLRELDHAERKRVFNLGYFTWVEQQGVELEDFDARLDQSFWGGLREKLDAWDALITETNERVVKG